MTGKERRARYSDTVVKDLFAVSRNTCAFQDVGSGQGCEEKLTNPEWVKVKGEIAHIRGLEPRSPRHDPDYDDPNGFWNLLVLCPNHHKQIDYLEPDLYTVKVLEDMKARHEERSPAEGLWASDADLARFAKAAIRQALDASLVLTLTPPDADEIHAALAEVVEAMEEREKMILTLHYFEGYSMDRIADILRADRQLVDEVHDDAVTTLSRAFGAFGGEVDVVELLKRRGNAQDGGSEGDGSGPG